MADISSPSPPAEFIRRWADSGASERANYASFLIELCGLLGVPAPDPTRPDDEQNRYVFEKAVTFRNGDGTTSPGRIDLYKRGCFVLEAKQGSDQAPAAAADDEPFAAKPAKRKKGTAVRGTKGWDDAMVAARGQAELYAKALPEWPPFLVVVDVGHCIELFSDFSRTGKAYQAFPDARTHRIPLADLARDDVRDRLRAVWTDPLSLDPTRRSAKVTRELAARLAELAKSLEAAGNRTHSPEQVAEFLMRLLFTMFAEDVGLLPRKSFTTLLHEMKGRASLLADELRELWERMNAGGYYSGFKHRLLQFNGGLFEHAGALPLSEKQLALLIDAAEAEWSDVEPAIFGTLLERALNPVERHKLGAHYTPRAYVERLVMPTVIEPLREKWDAARAAAVTEARAGNLDAARTAVADFLKELCSVVVLDPACGTGNFLYVTLEHMKRLEGEARDLLAGFGAAQGVFERFGQTVDPHQFRGIEVNPRAAAIAELVLWIGYLQWHIRTKGVEDPPIPVLQAFHNIECRDAVLAYDRVEPVLDDAGNPVTRWDGRTTKTHPVTGEDVPDDAACVAVVRYINPRKAEWPKADYVVGNPPFIGQQDMRDALGDGYIDGLRAAYGGLPKTIDFVMYWWNFAAELLEASLLERFGLVTTNKISQKFNRQVVSSFIDKSDGASICFAVDDQPWDDSPESAAVRIAMTVLVRNRVSGTLWKVVSERRNANGRIVELAMARGHINSDLTVGPDVHACFTLRANMGLAIKGFEPGSKHLRVGTNLATLWISDNPALTEIVKPYWGGNALIEGRATEYVIDFHGKSELEARQFVAPFAHVLTHVREGRAVNRESRTAENYWLFRRSGGLLRRAIAGLSKYIATVRNAKYRNFLFLNHGTMPDSELVVIASDSAMILGVLISRIHIVFAMRSGGWLGVGNDPRYNHLDCFNRFAFPPEGNPHVQRISQLAEELDAHRKARQAAHPKLTITDMYNVLERLRELDPKSGPYSPRLAGGGPAETADAGGDLTGPGAAGGRTADVPAGPAATGAAGGHPRPAGGHMTLTDKERIIHEQGLVSVLRQIHDDLDAAVAEAYGWQADLTDEQILARLVALNKERAAEEERGLVRWLRPEFQNPGGVSAAAQPTLGIEAGDEPVPVAVKKAEKAVWPATLAEQAAAVRSALSGRTAPADADDIAGGFKRAKRDRVSELLETLASLGQARRVAEDRYVAA